MGLLPAKNGCKSSTGYTSMAIPGDFDNRLWDGISSEKRELLRSFLRYAQNDISKFSRPTSRFNFRNGSIGNFFLTGARLVNFLHQKLT